MKLHQQELVASYALQGDLVIDFIYQPVHHQAKHGALVGIVKSI